MTLFEDLKWRGLIKDISSELALIYLIEFSEGGLSSFINDLFSFVFENELKIQTIILISKDNMKANTKVNNIPKEYKNININKYL